MEIAPKMYHLRTLKQLCYKHHAKSISGDLNSLLSRTIPKLDYSCHKGSSGRIAVLVRKWINSFTLLFLMIRVVYN